METGKHEAWVRSLRVQPFFVDFSYTSEKLSWKRMKKGDYLGFLSVVNLRDVVLRFKGYRNTTKKRAREAFADLVQCYVDDMVEHQKLRMLSGVSQIRTFVNYSSAFLDLVLVPIEHVRKDKGLVTGLNAGLHNFVHKIKEESSYVGVMVRGTLCLTI